KYLLQTGVAFSQSYMEDAFNRYPAIAGLLVELFLAKFDPRRESLSTDELKRAGDLLRGEMQVLIPEPLRQAHPALIDGLAAALSKPRDEQLAVIEETIGTLLETVSSL